MERPENSAVQIVPAVPWYKNVTYEDAKVFIKSNITSAARSFIAIGYYLKCVRETEMYTDDGYANVWEFAQGEYGISKSTASRYMSMNDRFSKDGNSPVIAEGYKKFGKSQLQEMLSLNDEQVEQVKPTDRVEDIRNMRKLREVPYMELPGQVSLNDFPGIVPEDIAVASKAREEVATSRPERQAYTISAEDLLPEPEQQEPKKPIAISQQELEPGYPERTGECIHQTDLDFECSLNEAVPRVREATEAQQEPKAENEKLEPCPFCGGDADVFSVDEVGYLGGDKYTVRCQSCMCGTGHYADMERAKVAWNRRTPAHNL